MTPRSDAASVATRHETIISTPGDLDLVMTRMFDAPRTRVWAAFTDPKHVPNWQTGPEGTTMPICEIDLRPGGAWRYVWRNVHGRDATAAGTFREVDPPRRFVMVTVRNDEEQTNTMTFTEESGRTKVTTWMRFASKTARDQALPYAKLGTQTNYAHLDAYLVSTN